MNRSTAKGMQNIFYREDAKNAKNSKRKSASFFFEFFAPSR
jgi:hypothetical protein